jgi:cell division protein ZapA
MPELDITIGGRTFLVACQPGEEHFLRSAAAMLDSEAQVLVGQMGRMTDARLLLMAGLMLADKTAALEDELREHKAKLAVGAANPVSAAAATPTALTALADLAARAEAMADQLEQRAS